MLVRANLRLYSYTASLRSRRLACVADPSFLYAQRRAQTSGAAARSEHREEGKDDEEPLDEQPHKKKIPDWLHRRPIPLRGQAIVTEDPLAPRINPVAIQLLSASLHRQIFPNPVHPSPHEDDIDVSRLHLADNNLLTHQPPIQEQIDFTLPGLKGNNIEDHFFQLGVEQAEPYLTLAEDFAFAPTPNLPARFSHVAGWVKYDPLTGEASRVRYPEGESMLTFDTEVLYKIHPYPVMAAACSPTHWYTWLSPWLVGESDSVEHLVPMGPPDQPRIIVGHNIGYDRSKILEEYSLQATQNRFLDTLSFHAAVQGVSGPQRNHWQGYWRDKRMEEKKRDQDEATLREAIDDLEDKIARGETEEVVLETFDDAASYDDPDSPHFVLPGEEPRQIERRTPLTVVLERAKQALSRLPKKATLSTLKRRRSLKLDAFGQPHAAEPDYDRSEEEIDLPIDGSKDRRPEEGAKRASKTWEDVTAVNSLAEVYKLHFQGEELDKSTREAFAATNPVGVRQDLQNLLRYCVSDVRATHRVYKKVLPRFRRTCRSPVSFAGALAMGSPILPVDQSWHDYVERSEYKFLEMNASVRERLSLLAEQARVRWEPPADDWVKPRPRDLTPELAEELACPEAFRDDPWLSQLDWTPKAAKWIRWAKDAHLGSGAAGRKKKKKVAKASGGGGGEDESDLVPSDMKELTDSKLLPGLLDVTWNGHPVIWSYKHGWICRYDFDTADPEDFEDLALVEPLEFTDPRDQSLHLDSVSDDKTVAFYPFSLAPSLPSSTSSNSSLISKKAAGGPLKKLTRVFGKTFLKTKAGKEGLECGAVPELLDCIREDQWEGLEDKIREALERKGVLGGGGGTANLGEQEQEDIFEPDDGNPPEEPSSNDEVSPPASPPPHSPTAKNDEDVDANENDVDVDVLHYPPTSAALQARWWPQWYHDLFTPKPNQPRDAMNLTVRTTSAVVLLRLSWLGYPLYKSREHGWVFRVPLEEVEKLGEGAPVKPVEFREAEKLLELEYEDREATLAEEELRASLESVGEGGDLAQAEEEEREEGSIKLKGNGILSLDKKKHPDIALIALVDKLNVAFIKVPHPDGDTKRVGQMIAKTSVKHTEEGTLTSEYELAREAIQMNAQCSYWLSVRDRVKEQMVVHQSAAHPMGFENGSGSSSNNPGLILPHVITMGTVTRRAIEKTWLTASNAKKNRVGSELKAMVRAPEGYKIVGADVDSEELWIASLMGDAQLGFHGACAIGWMTLEGTKSTGTDVHSKTAAIVGVSRDAAKVFNYSRIYGAGVRHATRLLLEGMKPPDPALAEKTAKELYISTKGNKISNKDDHFHQFWFGGSESYLFNAIEAVARSQRPSTPALACGITTALQETYLQDALSHMTSRINWVVQSSGVDYLHLLIVAVDYLCRTHAIDARYLLSVHDEVRYLVRDEDRYRLALALQIANLWTRSLFAYRLGMDDLPQGVAFFSAVDIDKVLRKEVDMPCVTPSNPEPIPPGVAIGIREILAKCNASLRKEEQPGDQPSSSPPPRPHPSVADLIARLPSSFHLRNRKQPARLKPQSAGHEKWQRFFVAAQSRTDLADVKRVWEASGRPYDPVRGMYQQRKRDALKFGGKGWNGNGGGGGGWKKF